MIRVGIVSKRQQALRVPEEGEGDREWPALEWRGVFPEERERLIFVRPWQCVIASTYSCPSSSTLSFLLSLLRSKASLASFLRRSKKLRLPKHPGAGETTEHPSCGESSRRACVALGFFLPLFFTSLFSFFISSRGSQRSLQRLLRYFYPLPSISAPPRRLEETIGDYSP